MKTKETKGTNLPGAWIVNPNDRGRKSIKSGNIYLDNGEEFQIELFNPLKECVLADIRLNGQSISKSGLVIKPGQRVYLDCFIEDKKKFVFQTYEVEMTGEVEEAIENNGLMEVFFYKEEAQSLKNWSEKLREVVVREYYPIYVDRYPYWYRPFPVWYGGCCTTTIGTTLGGGGLSFGGTTTNAIYNSSTSNSSNLFNGNITLTGGVSSYSSNSMNLINCCDNSSNGQLNLNLQETGRVERGQKSSQQFTEVDMDFEKNYIHSIVYQLLPNSKKPIEVETKKDLKVSHDAANLLVKLKDLKDGGVITEEEFQEKKKELLARI
jgi:hypothetical protein